MSGVAPESSAKCQRSCGNRYMALFVTVYMTIPHPAMDIGKVKCAYPPLKSPL